MLSKNPIWQAIQILSILVTPFVLISQVKSLTLKEDEISAKLRKINYYLVWKNNKYKLTNTDILNLLRAVYKEGNQEKAVAWTLINRFAWLYPQYPSLSSLIKAYSQPINPAWFPEGRLFKQYIEEYPSRKNVALKAAKQRILNSKLQVKDIPEFERKVILDILNGDKNPLKGNVHFISSMANPDDNEEIAREKQQNFANSRDDLKSPIYYESSTKGNNWFFSVPNSDTLEVSVRKQVIL